MENKENKGGMLSNEQVEKDHEATGKNGQQGGYVGLQDTGDDGIRSLGTEVQKRDGLPPDHENVG